LRSNQRFVILRVRIDVLARKDCKRNIPENISHLGCYTVQSAQVFWNESDENPPVLVRVWRLSRKRFSAENATLPLRTPLDQSPAHTSDGNDSFEQFAEVRNNRRTTVRLHSPQIAAGVEIAQGETVINVAKNEGGEQESRENDTTNALVNALEREGNGSY
jgi:hypothetical protein